MHYSIDCVPPTLNVPLVDNCMNTQHVRSEDKKDFWTRYGDLGRKLGKGSFGTVRLISDKISNQVFACKSINKRNRAGTDQISIEVEIMKRVKHRHAVKLIQVYETPKKVYIVMEYCNGGELVKKVQQLDSMLEEKDLKLVVERLASDIKPENVLLSTDDPNDHYFIKLSDFGLSAFSGNGKLMEKVCGTPLYMAPEVLDGLGYSQKCDIWSIGIMVALLLCNFSLLAESELREMVQKRSIDLNCGNWVGCSPDAKNLVEKMLQLNPAQRISAKEILIHPWISGTKVEFQNVLRLMKSFTCEVKWKKAIYAIIFVNRLSKNKFPTQPKVSNKSCVKSTRVAALRHHSLSYSSVHGHVNTTISPKAANSAKSPIQTNNTALPMFETSEHMPDHKERIIAENWSHGGSKKDHIYVRDLEKLSRLSTLELEISRKIDANPIPGIKQDTSDCFSFNLNLTNMNSVFTHATDGKMTSHVKPVRRSSLQGSKSRPLGHIPTCTGNHTKSNVASLVDQHHQHAD